MFISRRSISAWNAFKAAWIYVPFTKNKKRMTKFKETGDSRDVYQNELDKSCFEHDLVYENLKI